MCECVAVCVRLNCCCCLVYSLAPVCLLPGKNVQACAPLSLSLSRSLGARVAGSKGGLASQMSTQAGGAHLGWRDERRLRDARTREGDMHAKSSKGRVCRQSRSVRPLLASPAVAAPASLSSSKTSRQREREGSRARMCVIRKERRKQSSSLFEKLPQIAVHASESC